VNKRQGDNVSWALASAIALIDILIVVISVDFDGIRKVCRKRRRLGLLLKEYCMTRYVDRSTNNSRKQPRK
jgi:hypothetical protein